MSATGVLLVGSGLVALLTAFVHAVLGGREILRPTLAAPIGAVVGGTIESAWHLLTWHFAVLGVALVVAPWLDPQAAAAVAVIAGLSALGHAAAFVVVGLRRFGDPWHLPQWALFVPMAGTSLVAPWADGLGRGAWGDAAAVVAIGLFVAIAAMHAAWAAGSRFPAKDHDALVGLVVGAPIGSPMPGRFATVVVALGLLAMAGWTAMLRGWLPPAVPATWLAAGGLAMVAIFALRGIGGFFEVVLRPSIRNTPYMRWSRTLYSPIALLLATMVGCAMLA